MVKAIFGLLLAMFCDANRLISYKDVSFKSQGSQQTAIAPAEPLHLTFEGSSPSIHIDLGRPNRRTSSVEPGEDHPDVLYVVKNTHVDPDSVAKAILASPHDAQCTYEVSVNVIDDLLMVLGRYEVRLNRKHSRPIWKGSARKARSQLTFKEVMIKRRHQYFPPAPQTFYRYASLQGPSFVKPGERKLAAANSRYEMCVPVQVVEVAQDATTSSVTAEALHQFKNDFGSIKYAFEDLLGPLDQHNGDAERDGLNSEQVSNLAVTAANINKSHERVNEMIVELGAECDKFKVGEADVLDLFGLLNDYNQVKMALNANDEKFTKKDENLGQICASFQTNFESIDADLETLLSLNDQLAEVSQSLESVDDDPTSGPQHAALLFPQMTQLAQKIKDLLAKIAQSLASTEVLKTEATDALNELRSVAVLPANIQNGSPISRAWVGLGVSLLLAALV